MTAFVARRLIQAFFILILVSILIFLLMRLLPGDPLQLYMAENEIRHLTPQEYHTLLVQFGLDKTLPRQYFDWLSAIIHGDLGTSVYYHDKINKLLIERLPVTIHIGILSLIISSFFGILAGFICAVRRGSKLDTLITSLANLGMTVPIFWLGILMIYFFGLDLRWLPIQGYISPFSDFWSSTKHLIMPVFCLSTGALASNTRQTRSSVLEVIRQDYIRTAWSKGLSERMVVIRHALKNSLIPVITVIGIQVAHILGGSVLVETVFNIPGMGRLIVQSVFAQDYPVVQSMSLLISAMVVLTNLVVDISYVWIDPRIRYR
jgi:peptide/nickel transport system permease protein